MVPSQSTCAMTAKRGNGARSQSRRAQHVRSDEWRITSRSTYSVIAAGAPALQVACRVLFGHAPCRNVSD